MNEEIQIIEKEQENTLEIKTRAAACILPKVIGESYRQIIEKLEKENIKPSGAPYVRYINLDWKELNGSKLLCSLKMFIKKFDMLIGFPVTEKVQGKNNINSGILPKGRYVKALHKGPYQKVGKTYETLIAWIRQKDLKIMNECIEIYLNDPKTTKKENLETIILIPILDIKS